MQPIAFFRDKNTADMIADACMILAGGKVTGARKIWGAIDKGDAPGRTLQLMGLLTDGYTDFSTYKSLVWYANEHDTKTFQPIVQNALRACAKQANVPLVYTRDMHPTSPPPNLLNALLRGTETYLHQLANIHAPATRIWTLGLGAKQVLEALANLYATAHEQGIPWWGAPGDIAAAYVFFSHTGCMYGSAGWADKAFRDAYQYEIHELCDATGRLRFDFDGFYLEPRLLLSAKR